MPEESHDSLADLSRGGLYRRLVRQSTIYTLGTVAQQATSLLLLPVYLSYLPPEDFGILALCNVLTTVLAATLGLGVGTAITRFYWEWKKDAVEQGAVGSLWVIGSMCALAVVLALQMWGEHLLSRVITHVPFDPYLQLALWSALLSTVTQPAFALLRIREEAGVFVWWSYFTSASTLLLNGYFIAVAHQGALGIMRGNLIGALLSALIAVWVMWRRVTLEFRRSRVGEALRFALPMLPAGLFDSAAGGVDRYFLDKLVPLSQIGFYSVATRVANAGVRVLAVTSFKTAWIPFAIRLNTERADGRAQTAKSATLILAAASCLAVLTVLFSREVLLLIGRGAYLSATTYVPVLVFANLVLVMDPIAVIGFLMGKRTGYAVPLALIQLITGAALNLLLVPWIGAMGAAVATLGTFVALVSCRFWISQRYYPIPYDWKRLLTVSAFSCAILAAEWLSDFTALSVLASVCVKAGIAVVYVAMLVWLVLGRITISNIFTTMSAALRAARWKKMSWLRVILELQPERNP